MPSLNQRLVVPAVEPETPMRSSRLRRRALWGVCSVAALALTVGFVLLDGVRHVNEASLLVVAQTSQLFGLTVQEVHLSGRNKADQRLVIAALGARRDDPILTFDLAAARERLESVGWVRTANIARRLPSTIEVRLEEREPFALWQNKGELRLIDRDGIVITGQDLGRYARLPMVVGDDAAKHAAALLDLLNSQPTVQARVEAAVRVGGRRWNLRLHNGVDVLLPELEADQALQRLVLLDAEQKILERELLVIDLRVSDRLILRLSPDEVIRVREPGQNT
jgi:cell division protein FtsQ